DGDRPDAPGHAHVAELVWVRGRDERVPVFRPGSAARRLRAVWEHVGHQPLPVGPVEDGQVRRPLDLPMQVVLVEVLPTRWPQPARDDAVFEVAYGQFGLVRMPGERAIVERVRARKER